ncbi:fibroblast growth factor-binding protein 1-like [Erpetoichthys calabaricus]|uniref:fibroblast growth factor-binding protein 1-like n=1 Tax=Erpetoichthys calabaricus TaxID=27687 RepID=UPI0022342AE2|nr:fibroblast growth factor-binding protein 1-like [Erpetoichthys calabaricus]
MLMKSIAVILVLACVSQLLLVVECQKQEGEKKRKKEGKDKEQTDARKEAPAEKPAKGGKAAMEGKFSKKDKEQCSWRATEGTPYSLHVSCEKGGDRYTCTYTGNPAACSQYASDRKSYWKQMSRALKKQKNLCKDASSVLKVPLCKKAPQESHFKMTTESTEVQKPVPSADLSMKAIDAGATPSSHCTEEIDQKKLAEEYCSGSWTSFCNFFISMVQTKDC